MALDETDKAVLRKFAAADRWNRWISVVLLPLLPFPWYWLFQFAHDDFTLGFVCGGVGLFGTFYVCDKLPLWVLRAGSPSKILAGGEPTIRLPATVVHTNGDHPNSVSIMVDAPEPHGGWTNESIECGFSEGTNLTVIGFAPKRNPFRHVMLLESEDGRRWWSRGTPGGGEELWRTPEAFG